MTGFEWGVLILLFIGVTSMPEKETDRVADEVRRLRVEIANLRQAYEANKERGEA